jgi:hypothetical protein
MNFENALELAVVSSWPELVKPGEHCAIHVEYHDKPGAAIDSLQVWAIGTLGRTVTPASDEQAHPQDGSNLLPA